MGGREGGKEEQRINDAASRASRRHTNGKIKPTETERPSSLPLGVPPRIIKSALASLVWITAPNVDECMD